MRAVDEEERKFYERRRKAMADAFYNQHAKVVNALARINPNTINAEGKLTCEITYHNVGDTIEASLFHGWMRLPIKLKEDTSELTAIQQRKAQLAAEVERLRSIENRFHYRQTSDLVSLAVASLSAEADALLDKLMELIMGSIPNTKEKK